MGVADREYEWILGIPRLPQPRIVSSLYVAVVVGSGGRSSNGNGPQHPKYKIMTKITREFRSLFGLSD